MPRENEFVLVREFNAPRALVFEVWTTPKHIHRWWGPNDFTCPVCEMDLRPGGDYQFVMRGPDGTDYPMRGKVLDVVVPERIVMSEDCTDHPDEWHDLVDPNRDKSNKNPAGEITTTVTLEEVGPAKTRVTIHSVFETKAIRDAMVNMDMSEGWKQTLDKMDALLAELS